MMEHQTLINVDRNISTKILQNIYNVNWIYYKWTDWPTLMGMNSPCLTAQWNRPEWPFTFGVDSKAGLKINLDCPWGPELVDEGVVGADAVTGRLVSWGCKWTNYWHCKHYKTHDSFDCQLSVAGHKYLSLTHALAVELYRVLYHAIYWKACGISHKYTSHSDDDLSAIIRFCKFRNMAHCKKKSHKR